MATQLAKGVRLHVIPSEKFKTVSIRLKFKSVLQADTITKRSLIANLLDTNSQYYPTQTDFRRALSDLYGARFGTGVTKKGNFHILSASLNVVNDKYLSENGVVDKAIQFLHNILFYPNVFHGAFHKETFLREIENLRDDFDSIYNDKQAYASLLLKELYFDTEEQRIPSNGRKEDLDDLTPEAIFRTYESMLNEDEIDIFVFGDVDPKAIHQSFSIFDFQDREPIKIDLFYKKKDQQVKEKVEIQSVAQAKLNLAYQTDIYFHQNNFYAGQVFNGIFGGYPHSKLFVNVREKESLAYYASSGLDTFRGTMFVQAGIDQKEAKHVEDIIHMQLEDIRQGDFSDESMMQTKEMLKNSLIQSEDSAGTMIERQYISQLISQELDLGIWLEKIDKVTRKDVMEIAENIEKQATFLLKGKEK